MSGPPEPMKVCVITSVFPRHEGDPSASWLVEVVRRIQKKGLEVFVFCPSFKGLSDQTIHGIKVRRFRYFFKAKEDLTHDQGAPNKIRSPIYLFISFFYVLFGLVHFIRYCRKERFDVLHVHWPFPHGLFSYAGAKVSRAGTVLHFHGAELLLVKRFAFVKYFLKHAISHADRIVANSSFTKSKVQEIVPSEVEVIGFGPAIEEKRFRRPSNSRKRVLYVGRMIERKGVEYLVRAMTDVTARVDCELILVGDGDQKAKLQTLVHETGLDGRVRFEGVLPNEALNERYQQCDAFVLPAIVDSRGDTEGFGVVLIEALTYKKPIVASSVGGILDIIKHRETGLLVPEKDAAALARGIVEVLTDEPLAARLGENGYRHIKESFDWDRIADRIVGLYRDAALASRAASN